MYLAYVRFKEVQNLTFENVTFTPIGNLKITFVKSKTNKFKAERYVYLIPSLESGPLCPAWILRVWKNSVAAAGESEFFFPSLN